ncbi:hypothetical protein ACOMHN_046322 [Nucella lapillus]
MRQVQVRQEERQVQVRQVQVRHEERQVQVRQVQVQVRQEDLQVRRVQVPQVQVQQEERQGHVPQVQAAHYFGVSGYDLDCYPKEHLETLENIWNILEKAYGDQRPVQQLLTTFNSLAQYPGEGVRDFSNRVNKAFRDLTARQRAEGQRPLDEQILRDQFISGLQDGILMRQVRAKTMEGPGLSFIDVRSYVIKWELQETNMRKPAPHVEAAVASAEPQHALTDLTKMIKNGFSDAPGTLQDDARQNYLQQHLTAVHQGRRTREKHVTLTDNFEWAQGYTERFGLFHVDFTDPQRKRTPKESVKLFRQITTTNSV